jgi:succinyl-CoA synthetase beta subunit
MLIAEISVLASDVVRYEPEVQLHADARSDFDAAVNRYRAAQAAVEYIDEPIDLVRVARMVTEARYSMDRVAAIVDGREPPPPPEELQRVGRHGEPAVTLDENREPAYVGYPGGYGGGWFGGTGGGLLSGLLIGSMLGGGFGGWGHGDTTIINNDPDVKAIFINIFGGITKGEEVATGIIAALERVDIEAPIVIRLDGTNADEGRAILEPHLSDTLQMQPTMVDAARKVVEIAQSRGGK